MNEALVAWLERIGRHVDKWRQVGAPRASRAYDQTDEERPEVAVNRPREFFEEEDVELMNVVKETLARGFW
jgi:hypothetical protein